MVLERGALKWLFGKVRERNGCEKVIQKVISRTDIIDSPLERGNPRSSVRHRLTLERGKSRSGVDCTLPEVLQTRSPLERTNKIKGSRSSVKTPARAHDDLQRKILGDGNPRSSVKTPARAEKQRRRARSSVKIPARA